MKAIKDVRPLKTMGEINALTAAIVETSGKRKGQEWLKTRNKTIWLVGIKTMLRASDLLALTLADVAPDGKLAKICKIKEKKTGKTRTVNLQPALPELSAWLKVRPLNSDYLFPGNRITNGKRGPMGVKSWYGVLTTAAEWIGMDGVGTHTMRKTGAYMLYKDSGNDLALVSSVLNHGSIKSTLHYLGLDDETKDAAINHALSF